MEFVLFKNYSNTFVFDSKVFGPTITIFGGIHGNEIVGVKVINSLLKDIKEDKIKLLRGKLILAYGNEKAIEEGKRDYNYNLNRLFKTKYINKNSDKYEIRRIKELSDILNNTDVLLDIHSVSSKSEAFMFSEHKPEEIKISKYIGPRKIIVGWGDVSGDLLSGDTDSYMHSLGKIAFTIECGKHDSKEAFDVGYNTVIKLLKYYKLIKTKELLKESSVDLIEMYKIKSTKTGDFIFTKGMKNFKKIKKGELIGKDGEKNVYATENFIILLPNYEKVKPGEEVFYYGRYLGEKSI